MKNSILILTLFAAGLVLTAVATTQKDKKAIKPHKKHHYQLSNISGAYEIRPTFEDTVYIVDTPDISEWLDYRENE